MLIKYDKLKGEFAHNLPKLEMIIKIRENAPSRYKRNTEHLSSIQSMFSYIYHTALVRKYFPNCKKILDWGAFLGQVTYILQDEYDICAYNPQSSEIIRFWHDKLCINRNSFEKYEVKPNCDSNYGSASFDAILSSGVLEHTFEYGIDDITALRSINRLLKDEGKLLIWHLPAKKAFAEHLSERKKRWRHILRYDLNDILVKLSISGFSVLEIEKNELIFDKLSRLFPKESLPVAWRLDCWLSKLPFLHSLTHHYTIVAEKVKNFPKESCSNNYAVYA